MRIVISLLFVLLCAANICGGQTVDGRLLIKKKAGTEEFYLYYNYKGATNKTRLYYPFMDSAFVTDDILYKDKSAFKEKESLIFGDILVFSACDFNFTNKKILFFVDMKKNSSASVIADETYYDTGLPFFLITKERVVVLTNTLSFMDSHVEKTTLFYYQLSDHSIKLVKTAPVYISDDQAYHRDVFKRSKVLAKIFR